MDFSTRSYRTLVIAAVALALAAPTAALAQATSRGGSSGGSGSSGSSSGGSSAGSRSAPPGSTSTGSATSRGGSSSSSSGSATRSTGSSRGSSGATASGGPGSAYFGSRDRNGRPIVGGARGLEPGDRQFGDPFGPWGRWYPWYNSGWGFVSYDPWRYGTSRYVFGRHGYWYNPYNPWCSYWSGYDSLCDPFYGTGLPRGSGYYDEEPGEPVVGSIRLRVDPKEAQVFVDGALVGIVDDFDGLSDHLDLDPGTHQFEIRAEGYQPYTAEVEVEAGKTWTHRASLKKK